MSPAKVSKGQDKFNNGLFFLLLESHIESKEITDPHMLETFTLFFSDLAY